jgi:hypothetical protein
MTLDLDAQEFEQLKQLNLRLKGMRDLALHLSETQRVPYLMNQSFLKVREILWLYSRQRLTSKHWPIF